MLKNRYPIYIVSKGRADSRLTVIALERMGVDYYVVIEQSDFDDYSKVIDEKKLLILPTRYFDEYEKLDDLGLTKSTGPGPARNFAWDHSKENGDKRHWVMDDNLTHFYRLNRNVRVDCRSGGIFAAAEDFVDRYSNVPISGLNYRMFVSPNSDLPPFVLNTRIYSCLLIENDSPFRWRGRYNEDTIISLDVLTAGLCTIQFNAFLQGKVGTQTVKGGNTEEFYAEEGTLPKSKMLEDTYPEYAEVVWKFGRWHHHVNYLPFKNNELIEVEPDKDYGGINEYGMKLINKGPKYTDDY